MQPIVVVVTIVNDFSLRSDFQLSIVPLFFFEFLILIFL